jgi:hypothetical protein
VTYVFSGNITEVIDTNNYATAVTTSSTFTGTFTYNTTDFTASFPSVNPFYYIYIDEGMFFDMSLTIDGNLNFDPSTHAAAVANDEPIVPGVWGGDGFYFEANNIRSPNPVPPPVNWDLPLGAVPVSDEEFWLQFRFQTEDNSTFDTFDLPEQLPVDDFVNQFIRVSAGDLTDFGWLEFDGVNYGDGYQITGEITSLQLVPVPAAIWLFGSALGLLGWTRRMRA